MRKVNIKKIKIQMEIEHNRGRLIEGDNNFHTLIIKAMPEEYNYSNWTEIDLKDLANSINEFLKVIKN